MTINDRFKELRKIFGLSQEELGNKIGLSKSGISNIESGKRNVTDKHIKLICSELPINEEWLRDGIGEPVKNTPSSVMDQLRKEYNLDDISYKIIHEYLRLSQMQRKVVRDYIFNIFNSGDNGSTPVILETISKDNEDIYPPINNKNDNA